jgi:hypothetical protein
MLLHSIRPLSVRSALILSNCHTSIDHALERGIVAKRHTKPDTLHSQREAELEVENARLRSLLEQAGVDAEHAFVRDAAAKVGHDEQLAVTQAETDVVRAELKRLNTALRLNEERSSPACMDSRWPMVTCLIPGLASDGML